MQRADAKLSARVPTLPYRRGPAALAVRVALVTVASIFACGTALSQEVRWNVPATLTAGQHGALELVFEETQPVEAVRLPSIDGLQILGAPSQATSLTVMNGKPDASFTLTYRVRPERQGSIQIPSFPVQTRDGTQTVAGVTLQIDEPVRFGATRGRRDANDPVQAQLVASERSPYAGEVFAVDFIVAPRAVGRTQLLGAPEWKTGGLVTQPWSEGKQVPVDGGTGVRFRTRALAPQPGALQLGPVRQEVQINTGRPLIDDAFANNFFSDTLSDAFFDSFFEPGRATEATAESPSVPLDVRPLPRPAPAGFSGAVGQFELESKMVPSEVKVGEPVTWTLTLRGTGNWPGGVDLPARAIPGAFRTLQPKQQKDFAPNDLFRGSVSEDLVLIPSQPGTYHLDPVRFVYFDPKKERYETSVVEVPPLTVGGSAVAAATTGMQRPDGVVDGDGTRPEPNPAAAAATHLGQTAPHTRLPHDALPGAATGWTPLPVRRLATEGALPFLVLLAYWLCLSLRRARLTDPQRVKRHAFRQITVAIEAVHHASDGAERARGLFAWQRASAIVLDLDLAAPTLVQVRQREAAAGLEGWTELWAEGERALYSADADLPATWCDHAKAVCARSRRPRFNPLRLFLPHNLVPASAAAAVLLWAVASPGADATSAYANGEFAAAQRALEADVAAHPNDWIAHYNLGLSAAQLGTPGRALGETAAAFLLQPRNPSVRWNLLTFAAQLPAADRVLLGLAGGGGMDALARNASPAVWQVIMLAGAGLFCAGAAALLRHWYTTHEPAHRRPGGTKMKSPGARQFQRWLPGLLVLIGFTLGLAAVTSLHCYGSLANPAAALVAEDSALRSVPTAAQETQAQRSIPAGSVVVVHKDFLGWINVALADGESGWLRRDAVVPFYGAPQA